MTSSKWWIAGYTEGGAEIEFSPRTGDDAYATYELCVQAMKQVATDLEELTFVPTTMGFVRARDIVVIMARQS